MLRIAILSLVLSLAARADAALVQRGDKAPPVAAKNTAGKLVQLADLKGKQNVLLVFWSAETCSVDEDLRAVQKLYAGTKSKPLAILGVTLDGTKGGTLAKWLKKRKLTFTNLVDEKSKIADDYGVVMPPTFVLIDKDGIIQSRYTGADERTVKALATDVDELLRDGSVTAREAPEPSIPSG